MSQGPPIAADGSICGCFDDGEICMTGCCPFILFAQVGGSLVTVQTGRSLLY